MLDRVLTYVRAVLSGEKKGDPAVGRYLMDTLGASTEDLEKGGFNTSLQVRGHIIISARRELIDPSFSGYIDDLLSCEPCSGASRGFVATGPYSLGISFAIYGSFVVLFFSAPVIETTR